MRVLLRSTETGLFYAGPDQWTSRHAEAKDFEETARALDAAAATRTTALELLMAFDEPAFEIPLKIVSTGE